MTPSDFFRRADRLVSSHRRDRDALICGATETSLAHAARIYSAVTGNSLTEREALTLLACVKLARIERDPKFNADHYDDLLGYVALAGTCHHQKQTSGGTPEATNDTE